jgi:hypothetical protein
MVVIPERVAQDEEDAEVELDNVFKPLVLVVDDDETDTVAHDVDVEETLCVAEIVPLPTLAVGEIVWKPGEPEVETVSVVEGDPLEDGERLGDGDSVDRDVTDAVNEGDIDADVDDDSVTSNENVRKAVSVYTDVNVATVVTVVVADEVEDIVTLTEGVMRLVWVKRALGLVVIVSVVVAVTEEEDENVLFGENESREVELSHDDTLGVTVTMVETVFSLEGEGDVVAVEEDVCRGLRDTLAVGEDVLILLVDS